ncbi:MAG: hypothetical protein GY874_06015 [Desulfobacteraceae bacterium]|nr:hypothetical protein [Desulfobacteraceae bacterium]
MEFCTAYVIRFAQGYFIYIPTDENVNNLQDYIELGSSEAFCHALEYAHKRGFNYIRLDRSGACVDTV